MPNAGVWAPECPSHSHQRRSWRFSTPSRAMPPKSPTWCLSPTISRRKRFQRLQKTAQPMTKMKTTLKMPRIEFLHIKQFELHYFCLCNGNYNYNVGKNLACFLL